MHNLSTNTNFFVPNVATMAIRHRSLYVAATGPETPRHSNFRLYASTLHYVKKDALPLHIFYRNNNFSELQANKKQAKKEKRF